MQNQDPLIGQQIDGYLIEDLLGLGGMGRVYRGLDVKLNRYAAIKVMSQPAKMVDVYRKRFDREARSIAKLNHPNIVGIYRFNNVNNIYYLAMKYVDGADLRWVLRDYSASSELLDFSTLLKIITQLSSALDYAHQNGVIHRDIKPSNIMISRDGDAILTDFGLALDVQEGTGGEIFGSPHYIAPEQAVSSAQAVPQTDFYSLGVILYEMLTGSVPFTMGSALELAMAHIGDPVPDPKSINPDLHPAFVPILQRMLEKKPDNRYQDGLSFTNALQEAIDEAMKAKSFLVVSTINKPENRIKQKIAPLYISATSGTSRPPIRHRKNNQDNKVSHLVVEGNNSTRLSSFVEWLQSILKRLQLTGTKDNVKNRRKSKKLFLSYSSKNRVDAELLKEAFELEGYQIWMDEHLMGGDHWWNEIIRQIENCDILIIALSKDYLQSSACRKEYDYAFKLRKVLMPVEIQPISHQVLPTLLAQIQIISFVQSSKDNAIQMMIDAIDNKPIAPDLPTILPTIPGVPLSDLNRMSDLAFQTAALTDKEERLFLDTLREYLKGGDDTYNAAIDILKMRNANRKPISDKLAREIDYILHQE